MRIEPRNLSNSFVKTDLTNTSPDWFTRFHWEYDLSSLYSVYYIAVFK